MAIDPIQAESRIHPISVAFLVDRTRAALDEDLDAIATWLLGREWGRLSPIVPFGPEGIEASDWRLLEQLDPDVVYVYQESSDIPLVELSKRLNPFTVEKHPSSTFRFPIPHWRPPVAGTGHASLQPARSLHTKTIYSLESRLGPGLEAQFALRNFGCARASAGGELRSVYELKEPATLFEDLRSIPRFQPISLPLYRSLPSARLFWAPEAASVDELLFFCGDGVDLFCRFWNWVHFRNSSNSWRLPSVWVPQDWITGTRLAEIGDWARDRAISQDGGGPPSIRLVGEWSLEHAREAATALKSGLGPGHRVVAVTLGEIERATLRRLPFDSAPLFGVHYLPAPSGFVNLDVPQSEGAHAADLRLSRSTSGFRLASATKLLLPKSCHPARRISDEPTRVTRELMPSVLISARTRGLRIEWPSTDTILYSSICASSQRYINADIRPAATRRFSRISASPAGSRCREALALFPDLGDASRLFANRFWREVLFGVFGSSLSEGHEAMIRGALNKWAKRHLVTPSSPVDDFVIAASRQVHRVARELRAQPRSISERDIVCRAEAFRGIENTEPIDSPRRTEIREQISSRLAMLTEWGVLRQGVEIRCRRCILRTWVSTDQLSSTNRCPGCGSTVLLAPDAQWRFQLNNLLATAMMDDGFVPIVIAVSQLAGSAAESFEYLPGVSVSVAGGSTDDDIELDFAGVLDGQLIIGECKSRREDLGRGQVRRLLTFASDAAVERLVLACFEEKPWALPGWVAEERDNLAGFKPDIERLEYHAHAWDPPERLD